MELYNRYLTNLKNGYHSKIAFINTVSDNVIIKNLFFVQFSDAKTILNCKDGYYLDNNKFLYNLYWKVRKIDNSATEYLKNSDNYIISVTPLIKAYSYVKIIKDEQNPQLEQKILLFKYGLQILKKILDGNKIKTNKIFNLNISLIGNYPNFDSSYLTDYDDINYNEELNLNYEALVNFPTLNILKLQRKDKLLKLQNESSSNLISDLLNFGWNINFINNNNKISWMAKKNQNIIESNIEFDSPIDCIRDIYKKLQIDLEII